MKRVLVAALVFVVAWLAAPTGTIPLYDGIGAPDEPYRYVDPPAGYRKTDPPTVARTTHPMTGSRFASITLATAEFAPQFQFGATEDSLVVPAGAAKVEFRGEPLAPGRQPADGEIWGNVYRLSASRAGHAVGVRPGAGALVVLRAPEGPPPEARIEFRAGAGWRPLKTTRIGNDIYSAPAAGTGEYAAVRPRGGSAGDDGSVVTVVLVALGGVFVAAVIAIRIRRERTPSAS